MTPGWVALLVVAPFVVALMWLPVSFRRGQRECDRRNREGDEYAANWAALTEDDRAWLLDNGAAGPTLIHWEMR